MYVQKMTVFLYYKYYLHIKRGGMNLQCEAMTCNMFT